MNEQNFQDVIFERDETIAQLKAELKNLSELKDSEITELKQEIEEIQSQADSPENLKEQLETLQKKFDGKVKEVKRLREDLAATDTTDMQVIELKNSL